MNICKNKIRQPLLSLLLVFLLLPGGLLLSKAQPKDEKITRDFGFSSMEIFNFSDHTEHLVAADINRDGYDDLLFLNNQVSRLEILLRKKNAPTNVALPSLDECFVNKGFVIDNWLKDFQVRDMNLDKRPDIVSLADQRGMQIFFQEENGAFAEPFLLNTNDSTKIKGFEIADFNGDSFLDILVYRNENAEIYQNNGHGEFKKQVHLDFSTYGCSGSAVALIDNDNIPDLLFYFPKEELPLRLRCGKGNGEFDWEAALPLPESRSVEKLDLLNNGHCQLGMILKNGMILRLYEFVSQPGKEIFSQEEINPRRLPLKGISRRYVPTWARADLDGDGYDDFVAAAPQLNQIHLYKGSATGLSHSPQTIDSLRSVETLALTGDGDIVVRSEKEKAVAIHRNGNLSTFPRFLKGPGEPVAVATAGSSLVFVLFKDKDITLNVFDARSPEAPPIKTYNPGIRNTPVAMKVFPLNGDSHWGILLFMPYDTPKMFRLHNETITALTPEHFPALGSQLKPQAVIPVIPGETTEKKPLLLVCEGNVARLYRWESDRFVVDRQLNPHVESARLAAAQPLPRPQGGYLIYDEAGHDIFQFSSPPAHGVTRIHIKDGINDPAGLAMLRTKKNNGLLLIGKSEIQWIQTGVPEFQIKTVGEYVSRMEKPNLWNLFSVKLGSPGRPMAGLLDANNGTIELASFQAGKFVEELVFKVFQDPGFRDRLSDNTYEPHDLESADFNGDHIRDLAVLCHDKLILYIGE